MKDKHPERVVNCKTRYCYNDPAPGKSYCYKCRNRKYRSSRPIPAAYQVLKDNAKRRGINFDLSKESFEAFCLQTRYHELKGKTKESLTIDRKKNRFGYTIGNIQVLTLSENCSKGKKDMFKGGWSIVGGGRKEF